MNGNPLTAILVVDDRGDDVHLLMRAFKIVAVPNPLRSVDSVERAICYLKGEGEFSDREKYPRAFLVLLDMKLLNRSGLDLLRWVRSQPEMWNVIVVGMTSSEHPDLIKQAYQLGANSFLIKPIGGNEMNAMVKALHQYWAMFNRT